MRLQCFLVKMATTGRFVQPCTEKNKLNGYSSRPGRKWTRLMLKSVVLIVWQKNKNKKQWHLPDKVGTLLFQPPIHQGIHFDTLPRKNRSTLLHLPTTHSPTIVKISEELIIMISPSVLYTCSGPWPYTLFFPVHFLFDWVGFLWPNYLRC